MAITCGFFNSLEGDRKYDARQMGEMFDGLIMDGVFMSIGDALKTTPSSGMTVAVGTGRAWFLHTWTKNDSEYLIEVSAAESVLNRIDTIVLDVDNTEAVRNNAIKLIKGTPASNAKRQTLINTTDHKQIPLADILVPAGATTLATTNITNIVGTSECPYVTGPLSIIQNDDILAAWQEEFDTWFEGVKGSLDEDTAGNLYNLIQQRVEKTSVLDNLDDVLLSTSKQLPAGSLAVNEFYDQAFTTVSEPEEYTNGGWVLSYRKIAPDRLYCYLSKTVSNGSALNNDLIMAGLPFDVFYATHFTVFMKVGGAYVNTGEGHVSTNKRIYMSTPAYGAAVSYVAYFELKIKP